MIRAWLRREIRTLSLVGGLCLLFAMVCLLYGLPWEAVSYCVLLALCLMFLAECAGYFRYRAKLMEIELLLAHPPENAPPLPAPHDRLEHDYQALIQSLCNERTRQAAHADRARREMMDYYTLWAHQIKTPIAALRLILESEHPQCASEMKDELFRIEQYVEMALNYLRLNSASTDYVFRKYELDELVRSVVRKYARQFIRRKLRLNYRPMNVSVLTDEKWLCFVLEQVLSNALKYTSAGEISIYPEAPSTLVIQDTGMGIRPEDLPRVFEKGYTGLNGRTDKKSTGIGLYLCKRVCENLGHTIEISSQVGSGTKVSLRLERQSMKIE